MIDTSIDILHIYKNLVCLGLLETLSKLVLFCGWVWLYITVNGRKGGFVDLLLFCTLIWFGQVRPPPAPEPRIDRGVCWSQTPLVRGVSQGSPRGLLGVWNGSRSVL